MKMVSDYYRPTIIEIDLDALEHNLNYFMQKIPKDINLVAVVKANAYGHGVIPIVKHLQSLGVKFFAVAFLDEAVQLREAGILSSILVLGYTPKNGIEIAIKHNIALTVYTIEAVEQINSIGEKLKKKLKIHIKIDTGMGRLGLKPSDAHDFYQIAKKSPWIEIEGIYTHFATSDEKDKTLTNQQYQIFRETINEVSGLENIPMKHVSNTAAIIDLPKYSQTAVRLGIGLYGLLPSKEVSTLYSELKPVMSLKTKVAFLKTIKEGQTVSYGATFKAEKQTIVATLPIGYADGLSRKLSNSGYVLVKGIKAPIIGRICMDQTMIDVSQIKDINIGDEVVIIGSQNNKCIRIDDHAEIIDTINYEIVTIIGERIPKIYKKGGGVVQVINELMK